MAGEHTHVVIEVNPHRGGAASLSTLVEKYKHDLPKTMRAARANPISGALETNRIIYKLNPARHIKRRRLDKGITVRSCDLNAALDGYQPANNRQPADAPLWLVPEAQLQPAGTAHEAVAS